LGNPGQRIVMGHVFDARFTPPPLRDVHICGDEAAPFDWNAANLDGGPIRTPAFKFVRLARFRQRHSFRDQLFDIAGSVITAACIEAE
jgi:hypothetical protein